MPKKSTFLPVATVLMIVFVIGVVMLIGRTNEPTLSGDRNYPHQICTFDRYCEDNVCTGEPRSVIAYFEHENGEPRLEIPGMAEQATLEETDRSTVFTSTGGDLVGYLTIYRNRSLDFQAQEGVVPSVVEHFASGQCDRPVLP